MLPRLARHPELEFRGSKSAYSMRASEILNHMRSCFARNFPRGALPFVHLGGNILPYCANVLRGNS